MISVGIEEGFCGKRPSYLKHFSNTANPSRLESVVEVRRESSSGCSVKSCKSSSSVQRCFIATVRLGKVKKYPEVIVPVLSNPNRIGSLHFEVLFPNKTAKVPSPKTKTVLLPNFHQGMLDQIKQKYQNRHRIWTTPEALAFQPKRPSLKKPR